MYFSILLINAQCVPIGSKQTGNWNSTTTWNTGKVPIQSDRVIINATHTVTVNGSYQAFCKSMWLRSGGEKPSGQMVVAATSALRLKE